MFQAKRTASAAFSREQGWWIRGQDISTAKAGGAVGEGSAGQESLMEGIVSSRKGLDDVQSQAGGFGRNLNM